MSSKTIITVLLALLTTSCFLKQDNKNEKIIDIQIAADPIPEDLLEENENNHEENNIIYDLNIIDDSVNFSSLPQLEYKSDKFGVIANNDSYIYPYIELNSNEDLQNLEKGKIIPIGTIIPIEEVIEIKDTILDTHFDFLGDRNYFYKTTVDNLPVLIWGANLLVDFDSVEDVKKSSYYFKNNLESREFLPCNGDYNLTNKNLSEIKESRISIDHKTLKKDMISLYQDDALVDDNAIYISTDLITGSLNIIFKNIKKSAENNLIKPSIVELNDEILNIINRYREEDNLKNSRYTNELTTIYNYFLLSKVLLNYSDDGEAVNELLSIMPEPVVDEYNLIMSESGMATSPILNTIQDYSRLSPNGYYSSSDNLKSYYLGLHWFSEMNLDKSFVLVLGQIFRENEELKSQWSNISSMLTYLSGKSSFLGLDEIFTNLEEMDIYNLSYWIEDDKNLSSLDIDPTKFKLFNQITNLNTNMSSYGLSSGLEFAASLESKSANSLLKQSGINKEYEPIKVVEGTYLNSFMDLLQGVATFEQNDNFYHMEKGKWNQKVLNSVLGSWVEFQGDLNFDFNLDSTHITNVDEQSVTFNTVDYQSPIHFVEPNLDYFNKISILLSDLKSRINLETVDQSLWKKLDKFIDLTDELKIITELEISNNKITPEQNDFIRELPLELKSITGTLGRNESVTIKIEESLDMSINASTDFPYRFFVALKDGYGGKRIATGYAYSYYEFDSGSDKTIPFWSNNNLR